MEFKSLKKGYSRRSEKNNTQMRVECREYRIMFTALLSYRSVSTQTNEVMRTQCPAMRIIHLTL